MYFIMEKGDFQPAMLDYQSVTNFKGPSFELLPTLFDCFAGDFASISWPYIYIYISQGFPKKRYQKSPESYVNYTLDVAPSQ